MTRGGEPADLRDRFEGYRAAAKESLGLELALGQNIGIQFLTYCAPTLEQARADTVHNRPDPRNEPYLGTPDQLIELIEGYREECNLQMFQLRPSIGGLTFSQAMASLELFADKVMPHFKNDGGWVDSPPPAPIEGSEATPQT